MRERPMCQRVGCENRVKKSWFTFCSHACHALSRRQPGRPCAREGCANLVHAERTRFCSRDCTPQRQRRYDRPLCARPGCGTPIPAPENKYCSKACAALNRTKPFARCARPGCSERVNNHAKRYCSRSCGARGKIRSTLPRWKRCDICRRKFRRKTPSALKRLATCSMACQAESKRRWWIAHRLPRIEAKFGQLSLRERELFSAAYKAGYARGRESIRHHLKRIEAVA